MQSAQHCPSRRCTALAKRNRFSQEKPEGRLTKVRPCGRARVRTLPMIANQGYFWALVQQYKEVS